MVEEALESKLKKHQASPDPLRAPEFGVLRSLRKALSRGGLPAQRSPEDDARIAAFTTLQELLRVLDEFRKRVQTGERVRLRLVEQPSAPDRMTVALVIEPSTPRSL